jgi:hypothetical protein
MGNQVQPTLFCAFITEQPFSALQSHHQPLHKHEMDKRTVLLLLLLVFHCMLLGYKSIQQSASSFALNYNYVINL